MYMLNAENVTKNTELKYTEHVLTVTNTIYTSKNHSGRRISGHDCRGRPRTSKIPVSDSRRKGKRRITHLVHFLAL